MPICEICCEDVASEAEMKTHLLLSHLENKMHCPLCSLSGVSYDELRFHINTAHVEAPSNKLLERASMTHRGTTLTEDRKVLRTVTREEGHVAESLPPGTSSCEMPVPVAKSGTDNAVELVCGANRRPTTHSPEGHTFTKNSKDRQDSLELQVAMKQKRLSSPLKGTKDDDDDDDDSSCAY